MSRLPSRGVKPHSLAYTPDVWTDALSLRLWHQSLPPDVKRVFSYDAPTLHLQKISGFLTRRYAPLQKTLIFDRRKIWDYVQFP